MTVARPLEMDPYCGKLSILTVIQCCFSVYKLDLLVQDKGKMVIMVIPASLAQSKGNL